MRRVATLLGALAWALFSGAVGAVEWNKSTDFLWNAQSGNITAFPGQGSGNMWAQGTKSPTATGPKWTGPQKQLPFNPSPTANFSAKFTGANIGKAMMNPGTALVTLVGGYGLHKLMTEACVRVFGGTMQLASGGQWEECNFITAQRYATKRAWNGYRSPSHYATRQEACGSYVIGNHPGFPANDPIQQYSFACYTTGGTAVWTAYDVWSCPSSQGSSTWTVVANVDSNNLNSAPACTGQTTSTQDGYKPITPEGAEAKIAAKAAEWTQADFLYGYDPSNAAGRGLDKALDELMNAGVPVKVNGGDVGVTVQTPINSPPKVEETVDPATGKVTRRTTNTVNNFQTTVNNDNSIKITHNTTTTTTTSSTINGQTTVESETTTSEEEKDPDKGQCEKYPDTLGCEKMREPSEVTMPELPDLYEQKYPDGLGGLWTSKIDQIKASPLFSLASQLAPSSLGDSAGCPQWSLPLNVGIVNWGEGNPSIPCGVWTFLRIVTLIGALLLARALIFGG